MIRYITKIGINNDVYEAYYDKEKQCLCIPLQIADSLFYFGISKDTFKEIIEDLNRVDN